MLTGAKKRISNGKNCKIITTPLEKRYFCLDEETYIFHGVVNNLFPESLHPL